jgi:hypothetical protein
MIRNRSSYKVYLAGLALLAGAVVWVETSRQGIGLSPDSVKYIQLARQLAQPGELDRLFLTPVSIQQPPLYPVVLALLQKATGTDPVVAVRALNALLFAILIYVSGAFWFARFYDPPQRAIALLAPLFLLFSRSLQLVFSMAWTEPLFLVLVVAFLLCLSRHLERRSPGILLAATLCAILAVYTRYVGITLVAVGLLLIPLPSDRPWTKRAGQALLFAAAVSVALGVWVARNLYLSGTSLGERGAAVYSLLENVGLSLSVLQGHVLPASSELPIPFKLALVAVLGALAAWVYLPLTGYLRGRFQEDRSALLPCVVFFVVFYAFTVFSSTSVAYDPINFRLLAPLYVPAIVVLLSLLGYAMSYAAAGGSGSGRVRLVTILLVALALVQPVRQFAGDFGQRYRNGSGLNERSWKESELIRFLETWVDVEAKKPLFSNVPNALAWYLSFDAHLSPRRIGCATAAPAETNACFVASTRADFFDSYLIYFDGPDYPYLYAIGELGRFVELAPIAELADGGLYAVSPRRAKE